MNSKYMKCLLITLTMMLGMASVPTVVYGGVINMSGGIDLNIPTGASANFSSGSVN